MYGVWSEMLKESRLAFGPAPRKLSLLDRWNYFRIKKPSWMRTNSSRELSQLLDRQVQIFRHGVVIWGHIVQANEQLFEPGKENSPALVVFAPDPDMQMDPHLLQEVAERSYQLKGSSPRERDKIELANLLEDELSQPMGFSIPRSVCSIGDLVISCTLCERSHFPKRQLCGSLFPLVRHADNPHWVLPLPERFWAKQLIEWWES